MAEVMTPALLARKPLLEAEPHVTPMAYRVDIGADADLVHFWHPAVPRQVLKRPTGLSVGLTETTGVHFAAAPNAQEIPVLHAVDVTDGAFLYFCFEDIFQTVRDRVNDHFPSLSRD
jgi:hypothetical protein